MLPTKNTDRVDLATPSTEESLEKLRELSSSLVQKIVEVLKKTPRDEQY